jgi:hypothetical protein
LSVIVSVFYPLWYRSYRLRIKEILNTDTNAAKSLLDSAITEHDTMTNDINENSILHHAKDHLDSYQNTNQETQKEATTQILDES